jgi:hypothetical protein
MQLPPLHDAASSMSMRAQREFLWATRVQLALTVIAAIAGVVTLQAGKNDTRIGAVVGLVAFLIALLIRAYTLATRPEGRWYEGRAAAESVKTLAWRYAVGGNPFARSATRDADGLLVQRINEVLNSLSRLETDGTGSSQVTDDMRSLRGASLPQRRATYG